MGRDGQGWPGPRPPDPEPITVPEAEVFMDRYFEPEQSIPVWVRMSFSDGSTETMAGFAQGWTRRHVKVQVQLPVDYYRAACDVWVLAENVRRRKLQRQR